MRKKIILNLLMFIFITGVSVTAVSAHDVATASNYQQLSYWNHMEIVTSTGYHYHLYVTSDKPLMMLNYSGDGYQIRTTEADTHCFTGNTTSNEGSDWTDVYSPYLVSAIDTPIKSLSIQSIRYLGGNYAFGTYVPPVQPTAEITYPDNESQGYTDLKEIWFTLTGYTVDDIAIQMLYVGADGKDYSSYIHNSWIEWHEDMQCYIIPEENVPWGIGVNKIRIYSGLTLLDEKWITMTKATASQCYITGVTEGASYVTPPALKITKVGYSDSVGFLVNGEKYVELTANFNGIHNLYDFYWNNCVVGNNALELRNMRTGETIEHILFTVTRGYIDEAGNYDYDYEYIGGDGTWGNVPYSNFDQTTITDFATSIPATLSKLATIFTPVMAFVTMIFNSIPPEIAVGLFALISVTIVFTIIKVIRG